MADLSQHANYTGKYSGLLDNFWVTLAVAGICLVGYEIEVHIPRRRGKDGTFQRVPVRLLRHVQKEWRRWRRSKWKADGGVERPSQEGLVRGKGGVAVQSQDQLDEARRRLGPRESWEFGYIYQPKAWRLIPGPPLPRWPLAWIWSSLKVKEEDMPETCGLDITLHMRFLRGVFFYTSLQACIVLPILMPLHIFYSPKDISKTSMTRASVSSLVESSGSRWLWVHAILIWWITITWTMTVLWITWGALAYRRREICRLSERVKASRAKKRQMGGGEEGIAADDDVWTIGDDREGIKRFRTLMVTNVPPDMRSEQVLQDYFDHYIHRHRVRSGQITPKKAVPVVSDVKDGTLLQRVALSPKRLLKKPTQPKKDLLVPTTPLVEAEDLNLRRSSDAETAEEDRFESEVDEVILVRKLGSVDSLRGRRMAVLRQLEIAHVKLAQRVLKAVSKHKAHQANTAKNRITVNIAHDVEKGVEGLNASRDEKLDADISKADRMERLVQALGGFVDDEPAQLGKGDETVWDVLHALPRELLDPYQSLTHLTSLFRNQNAPLIDYLSTKLTYLTLLLDEARSKPLSSYSASSTAFVTFKDARTARLALKILDSHPKRSLACHTMPAPDWTNLLWPRLGKSVYRSEFVRGWVVYLGVWAFTLVWIFPVSLLCALSSLTNIAGFIKPLEQFVAKHPQAASVITSLVPVLLVAGLTIAICPILLVIANKAETIYTRLGIHNSVLERFWKFLMVNGVVFFAIGQSAIQAYLTAFQNNDFDPLPTVATAFPTAAPYFASYVLLQTAIQPFFELFRLGLPAIVYVFGTRVSVVPRQRNSRTEYPTFSHFSQVPLQLLAVAIMHLFMLLNPLVIPFCFVYYGSCYLVWKKQFTYVYGRLYENNGRRTSIRVLRYSLDALALSQFVLLAFFILNKARGHAIATGILCFLTLVQKLIITRALKRRFDNLDVEEADILCPPVLRDNEEPNESSTENLGDWTAIQTPSHSRDRSAVSSRLATFRHDISTWAGQWGYAASHRSSPIGYRKPIPFDHVLFATLDSKFNFAEEESSTTRPRSSTLVSSQADAELHHDPDQAIHHETISKLVVPHHDLRPWEDIPPYQRSRGYNDQPAYTNDYDDFMWLPRDPLSTLDLDDTVEMRLTLTTSAGGPGQIGDWPPVTVDEMTTIDESHDETWQEVYKTRDLDRQLSPDAGSDQRLIDIPISPNIGSEVNEGAHVGLVRRGTKRVGDGLHNLFNRPRSNTHKTDHSSTMISMRTLSISSSPSAMPASPTIGSTNVGGVPNSDQQQLSHRPSIMLVTQAEDAGNRVPTPNLAPLRTGTTSTSTTSCRPEPARSPTSDSYLSPTRTSTPRQMAGLNDSDPMEELDIGTPARSSHLTIQLGRTPSGRRPSRLRAGSRNSHDQNQPVRSASIVSPTRSRSIAMAGRGRSTSIWSNQAVAQQMWLNEVMEEERLASEDSKKEELKQEAKDHAELMKESKRRNSGVASDLERRGSEMQSGGLARSASRLSAVSGLSGVGRSTSKSKGERLSGVEGGGGRPGIERGVSGESGGSGRSGLSRGSIAIGYPPKTAPL